MSRLIEPGPVESRIATNGLAWFERNIDHEHSVHREAYQAPARPHAGGGSKSRLKLKPDAVYAVLRHALLARHPRPHYVVTLPARIGVALKRLLPAALLYRMIARYS